MGVMPPHSGGQVELWIGLYVKFLAPNRLNGVLINALKFLLQINCLCLARRIYGQRWYSTPGLDCVLLQFVRILQKKSLRWMLPMHGRLGGSKMTRKER